MKALANFVHRFASLILIITFIITGAMVPGIGKIKTKQGSSPEKEFTVPDELIHSVLDIKKTFGGSVRTTVVAVQAQGQRRVIEKQALELITEISNEIAALPIVRKGGVLSLSTMVDFIATDEGLQSVPFLKQLPHNYTEEEAFKGKIQDNDLVHGKLVSKDFKTSIIAANILEGKGLYEIHNLMTPLVAKYKNRLPNLHVYLAGAPEVDYQLDSQAMSETKLFMGLALVLLFIAFYVVFKTWRGVFIPFITSTIGIVWTMGLMGYYGQPIEIVSALLPVLLVVTGSAYAIYVYLHLSEECQSEISFRNAYLKTLKKILIPLFSASMTTFIGSMTLLAFRVEMIQHFGLFSAIGTLILFILAVLVIPAFFVTLRAKISMAELRLEKGFEAVKALAEKAKDSVNAIPVAGAVTEVITDTVTESVKGGVEGFKRGIKKANMIDRMLKVTSVWVIRYPKSLLLACGGVILAGVFYSSQVVISFDNLSMLPKASPIRSVTESLNRAFNGIQSFDLVLDTGRESGATNPDFLKKVELLQKDLSLNPEISHTFSIADLIRKLDSVLNPENGKKGLIPSSGEAIAQYLLLVSFSSDGSNAMNNLITPDHRQIKISVTTRANDTQAFETLYRELKDSAGRILGSEVKLKFGGSPMVWISMMKVMILGKFQNILATLLCIILLLIFTTRSLIRGMYTVITLPIGVLLNFGIMGFLGIRLDIVTAIITSFAMGMGVDFAIHLISAVKLEYEKRQNLDRALEHAILTSGKAISLNAITSMVGFSALMFSKFSAVRNFAILMCFSMLTLSILSVVVLPSILKLLPPEFITEARSKAQIQQSLFLSGLKYGGSIAFCLLLVWAAYYIEVHAY